MQEVMIGFQFSALIPIIVFLIFKPTLNLFFKILFASILLSILFDAIADVLAFMDGSNLYTLFAYYICNTILITFLWQKVPFYSKQNISFVRNVGYTILGLMILAIAIYSDTPDSFYIVSSLSVVLGLLLALYYYYKKILLSSNTPILNDPYFITATGFILFSLSTITILACHVLYEGHNFLQYTWVLRQVFYLIYNIIIAFAFYVLYQTQKIK